MAPDEIDLTQLRRGVVQHCVLALLEHGPHYSYDLVSSLSRFEPLVTSEGTIYPLLSRHAQTGAGRHRPAGLPAPTLLPADAGRRQLVAFRTAWTQFRHAADSVLGTAVLSASDESGAST